MWTAVLRVECGHSTYGSVDYITSGRVVGYGVQHLGYSADYSTRGTIRTTVHMTDYAPKYLRYIMDDSTTSWSHNNKPQHSVRSESSLHRASWSTGNTDLYFWRAGLQSRSGHWKSRRFSWLYSVPTHKFLDSTSSRLRLFPCSFEIIIHQSYLSPLYSLD